MTIWSGRKPYHPYTQDLDWTEEQASTEYQEREEIRSVASCLLGGGMFISSYLPAMRRSGMGNIFSGVGAVLFFEGVKRYCSVDCSSDMNHGQQSNTNLLGRRKVNTEQAIKIQESILIQRPAVDLYQFWRNIENLPSILTHIHSVNVINEHLSHWMIETVSGGPTIEWDAKIINEVPNKRIGWSTLQDSDIDHAGSVVFETMPDGNQTQVTVTLQYVPPAGRLGSTILKVLGQDPKAKIVEDLQHFKERMEAPVLNEQP
ncbi:SRPBCC family protein [Candidatus Nitrospira salsa]